MSAWREDAAGLTVDVQVVPRAARDRVGPLVGERVKVQLTAPPVDGAANEALVALLAKSLGVAKRDVRVLHGEKGRKKTVRVEGGTAAALAALVGAAA